MAARLAHADTPRRHAILTFVDAILRHRGSMPDEELDAARLVGLQQSTLLDIVAVVAENNLGNYINNLARTPVDPVLMDAAERIEMGAAGVAQ
jgi:alkylhydroperoxidase family enzyme